MGVGGPDPVELPSGEVTKKNLPSSTQSSENVHVSHWWGLEQFAHTGLGVGISGNSVYPVAFTSFPKNQGTPKEIRLLKNRDPNSSRESGDFHLDFPSVTLPLFSLACNQPVDLELLGWLKDRWAMTF